MKALPVSIVLVLVVLLAAGCGSAADAIAGDDDGEDAPYGTCTIGDASADVQLTVDGYGAEATCDELIRNYAAGGDLWRRRPPDGTLPTVCQLEAPNGAGVIDVRDSGSAYFGQQVCASWIADGWLDVTSGY